MNATEKREIEIQSYARLVKEVKAILGKTDQTFYAKKSALVSAIEKESSNINFDANTIAHLIDEAHGFGS